MVKLVTGASTPIRDPIVGPGGLLSLPWQAFFGRLGEYLDAIGGQVVANKTVTASYTVESRDVFIEAWAASGAITIALPPGASHDGKVLYVKKMDATANTITIDANGSEKIDGALTQTLTVQYETLHLISNGGHWSIV